MDLELRRDDYLVGFGGLGFVTPVVSYAPLPMFMLLSSVPAIMEDCGDVWRRGGGSLAKVRIEGIYAKGGGHWG